MSKKIRKKPHSFKKRRQAIAEGLLKDLVVVFVSGTQYARLYDIKKNGFVLAYPEIDRALRELKFNWSCLIATFCVDQTGTEYMKSEIIESKEKVNREQIVDIFVAEHSELIESSNPEHYRGYGWIASVAGLDIDENQAGELFSKLDAWRLRTVEEQLTDAEVAA